MWLPGLLKLFLIFVLIIFIEQIILTAVTGDSTLFHRSMYAVHSLYREKGQVHKKDLTRKKDSMLVVKQSIERKLVQHENDNSSRTILMNTTLTPGKNYNDTNLNEKQIDAKLQDKHENLVQEKVFQLTNTTNNSDSDISKRHKFVNRSLETYDILLYKKLYTWFIRRNCTNDESNFDYNDLILHRPKIINKQTKTILFTTFYSDKSKQFIFMNTLRNWSLLKPYIQAMLYISDIQMLKESGLLIYTAYKNDWILAAVPKCFKSYPLLNSMYKHVRRTFPDVIWYMYANGDIQFTVNLWKILEELDNINKEYETKNKEIPFTFVSGKRKNVYLEDGHLLTMKQLKESYHSTDFHTHYAIDYFIYHKTSPMLNNMPPFAVGRRGYDNWLVYNAVCNTNSSVDISRVNPAIHIAIKGKSQHDNSHRVRTKYQNYNVHLKEVVNSPLYFPIGSITNLLYLVRFHKESNEQNFKIKVAKKDIKVHCKKPKKYI